MLNRSFLFEICVEDKNILKLENCGCGENFSIFFLNCRNVIEIIGMNKNSVCV